MHSLLISDLHLESQRADITATLVDFLRGRARRSDRLFILGDLFEVWVGDDEDSQLARQVAGELLTLSQTGVEILLMHGNRDFLLGANYASRCGARLIEEPFLFEHLGRRIALVHGDALCTDDIDYQNFRAMVRDPAWQQGFLSRPLADRQAFARQARQQSMANNRSKSQEIMDINPDAVRDFMQRLELDTLIHGHTHRPDSHRITLDDNRQGTRLVLGDWDSQGWLIEMDDNGIRPENFPLLGQAD